MNTLLVAVAEIEQKAQNMLSDARSKAEESVQAFAVKEQEVADDVRVAATRKGEAIAAELIKRARDEANTVRQQEQTTIETMHATAKSRREQAVAAAIDLLKREYLG